MNTLALKVGVKTLLNRTGFFLKKHGPQLMIGGGIAGFVGTAVMTGTATLKAQEILNDRDERLGMLDGAAEEEKKPAEKEIKRKTALALVKTYSKPVGLGVASTGLILAGSGKLSKRAATALASAYEAQSTLHKYRQNVTEQLGIEADKRLAEGLPLDGTELAEKLKKKAAEEKKNPEGGVTALATPKQDGTYEWLFSSETCGALHGSGVWRDDPEMNRVTLLKAQNNSAPDMLLAKGWLLINDILIDIFGAEGTTYGATHGWVIDPETGEIPTISFGLNDIAENPGLLAFLNGQESNVWLRFNCDAAPIIEKIDRIQSRRNFKRRLGDRTQRYITV